MLTDRDQEYIGIGRPSVNRICVRKPSQFFEPGFGLTRASDLQQDLQQKRTSGARLALDCISASFISRYLTSINLSFTILYKQATRIKSPLVLSG